MDAEGAAGPLDLGMKRPVKDNVRRRGKLRGLRRGGTTVRMVMIGFMGLAWPLASAKAESGKIPYDPATCSTDAQDMVYFAVRWRVFRQPKLNLTYIGSESIPIMATLPKPPKPAEPVGCPDHPIQAAAFFFSHISAMPGEALNPASRLADSVSVVLNGANYTVDQNAVLDPICKKFRLPDESVPGFNGCAVPVACGQRYFSYQAKDYQTPDGSKIAMYCTVGLQCRPQPMGCNGGYRLHANLMVNFSFSTAVLSVQDFIAADQEIRRRLDAAELKDYQWPETQ